MEKMAFAVLVHDPVQLPQPPIFCMSWMTVALGGGEPGGVGVGVAEGPGAGVGVAAGPGGAG
jgi:hypothetical protein